MSLEAAGQNGRVQHVWRLTDVSSVVAVVVVAAAAAVVVVVVVVAAAAAAAAAGQTPGTYIQTC